MKLESHPSCGGVVFQARLLKTGARVLVDGNEVPTSTKAKLLVIVAAGAEDTEAIVTELPEGAELTSAYRQHECRLKGIAWSWGASR